MQLKLPETLRFGTLKVKVSRDPLSSDDDGSTIWGKYRFASGSLQIADTFEDPTAELATFLHEIVHVLLERAGASQFLRTLDNVEEMICDGVAWGLTDFLLQNHEFLSYLGEVRAVSAIHDPPATMRSLYVTPDKETPTARKPPA